MQLASCCLEWCAAGAARPLRARIRSTPALHPHADGAARAAALLALHVLLPDAVGPWLHTLALPCSVAASAAAAARWAPARVGELLAGARAGAWGWMAADAEQPAGAGAARGSGGAAAGGDGSSSGASGGGVLAAGRAAAWVGLFLYRQLLAASEAAALLVGANTAWALLHPHSHYLGQCVVALMAVAAEYSQLSAQAARGVLKPGAPASHKRPRPALPPEPGPGQP